MYGPYGLFTGTSPGPIPPCPASLAVIYDIPMATLH